MDVRLVRAGIEDAEKLWKMQVTAFKELYDKYQDTETSPATEPMDKIIMRLEQPFTYYYFIIANSMAIGAIRIVDKHEYGGYSDWELETILEEKGNCYLYEKMGYSQTGEFKPINEKMTLVSYKKQQK